MTVDDLDHIVSLGNIFGYIVVDDLALVVLVEDFFLHHAFADCSHLRTVLRIDDGGDDISSECRTDLVEKVFIDLSCLLVLMASDFQSRAVGCKTACQRG